MIREHWLTGVVVATGWASVCIAIAVVMAG